MPNKTLIEIVRDLTTVEFQEFLIALLRDIVTPDDLVRALSARTVFGASVTFTEYEIAELQKDLYREWDCACGVARDKEEKAEKERVERNAADDAKRRKSNDAKAASGLRV